jgi:hypothetical protein
MVHPLAPDMVMVENLQVPAPITLMVPPVVSNKRLPLLPDRENT